MPARDHDRTSSIGTASVAGLDEVRAYLAGLASEAEIPDPEDFAGRWQTLMLGAIIAADTGNLEAAKGAGRVGAVLLDLDGVAS